MIPQEVMTEAIAMGFEGVEEVTLKSGETVYVMVAGDAKIGLPIYLHYVDELLVPSTGEQAMALFDEPDYTKDDE